MSKIGFTLGHTTSISKFKKTEINHIKQLFHNNVMKLEINYKKKGRKTTNAWLLGSMLLNNYKIIEEIKEEIKGLKTELPYDPTILLLGI